MRRAGATRTHVGGESEEPPKTPAGKREAEKDWRK